MRLGLFSIILTIFSVAALFLVIPIYGVILIRDGNRVGGVLMILSFFAMILLFIVGIQVLSGYKIDELFKLEQIFGLSSD